MVDVSVGAKLNALARLIPASVITLLMSCRANYLFIFLTLGSVIPGLWTIWTGLFLAYCHWLHKSPHFILYRLLLLEMVSIYNILLHFKHRLLLRISLCISDYNYLQYTSVYTVLHKRRYKNGTFTQMLLRWSSFFIRKMRRDICK